MKFIDTIKSKIFTTILILVIIMIIGVGTYALTIWTSKENTELTIRIGDIEGLTCLKENDINVTDIGPVFDYEEDGEITEFTVLNNTSNLTLMTGTLKINNITENIQNEDFKYVVQYSENKQDYEKISEGNFSDVQNGDEIEIFKEKEIENKGFFKVIFYLDGNSENPIELQGGSLESELTFCTNTILKVSATNVDLRLPGTKNVTYEYYGDGTLSCSSSNTNIVTCSVDTENKRIVLTSVADGTAVVSLNSTEGSYHDAVTKEVSVIVDSGKYTINLNKNCGTASSMNIYAQDISGVYLDETYTTKMTTTTNPVTPPTCTGYQFNGYYTATTGGTQMLSVNGYITSNLDSFSYNDDVTFYGQWNPNTYNITYVMNDGTVDSSAPTSATYDTVINIKNPTRSDGYEFTGWTFDGDTTTAKHGASDSSVTTSWNNTATSVKSEYFKNLTPTNGATVTMTANFKKELTATFKYYNNKTITKKCELINNQTSCNITAPTETELAASGYTLRGLSTADTADATTSLNAGATLTLTGNVTYYASYQMDQIATFYYSNLTVDNLVYSEPQVSTTATATKYMNYAGTFKHNNYTIPDEVSSSTGGGAAPNYQGIATSANSATTITTPTTANTAFYAVYNEDLTFYYYTGSVHTNTPMYRLMLSDGTNYVTSLSANEPTPASTYDGASLKGWSYTNNSVNKREPLATGVNELYAYWQKTLTVTYDRNECGTAPAAQSATKTYISNSNMVELTSNISISSQPAGCVGSVFKGWNTKADGTGTSYQPGDSYTMNSSMTLYAQWEGQNYTIEYNYNGGSVSNQNPTIYSPTTTNITLNNPIYEYKTFSGWSEEISTNNWYSGFINIDSGAIETSNASYPNSVYSEMIYLKANVTYTITGTSLGGIRWRYYDTNGTYIGNVSQTSTYKPTQNGYVRVLLYEGCTEANRNAMKISSSHGTTVTIVTGSTGNRKYTASYTSKEYTISYDANGGIGAPDSQKKTAYVSTTLSSTIPTRIGYTFKGWSTNPTATSATYAAGSTFTMNGTIILYAVWEGNDYNTTYVKGLDLITGRGDVASTRADRMTYSITDDIITVTANNSDGYGYTPYRVELTANKSYIFNLSSSGAYGGGSEVEAFLMLNGSTSVEYHHMSGNVDYVFTPRTSGTYWLRLDVNTNENTETFSEISISEVISTDTEKYKSTYGTMPTSPSATGYVFNGWTLVPSDYQQVEYIESTGTQYIKTGVTGTARWEFDIQFTDTTTRQLMGYGGSGAEYWGVQADGKYGVYGSWNINAGNRDNIIHNYGENGSYYMDINGTNIAVSVTDVTSKEYTFFGIGAAYFAKAKLYRVKTIQNGVLIRDFIPCYRKRDNAVGLYDRVTGKFFPNSGSGSFRYGSNAYITSTTTVDTYDEHVVYGNWTANTYTVSYNANGGTGAPASQTKTYGRPLTLSSTIPIHASGLAFKGWGTTASASSASYQAGGKYTNNASATLYAVWADEAKPTISSTSVSTTYDIRNFVSFTATDNVGITGYNITTSTTAPTTWIPVISTVENATETKYAYSASWARVFHHNTHYGNVLYSSANTWAEAKSSNTVDKYSVLGNMANYANNSSVYEMLLEYPELTGYNRWTQTGNPVTTTVANGTGSETAPGYTAKNISWTSSYWGGLTLSTSSATFINGSVGHPNWFYAIGAASKHAGGIPGPTGGISHVNLWARIDEKSITPATSLTRRIGDISANGTYYVWVRDAKGNTQNKSVTINRVDTTVPTVSITAAVNTATLNYADNVGANYYYFGTSNPKTTNVTWTGVTSTTSGSASKTISAAGTYYLGAQDTAGNISSIASKTYYSIAFNCNGGTGTAPATQYKPNGVNITLPANTCTKNEYIFKGWSTSNTATSAAYNDKASFTNNANTTLYAVWERNTFTLTAHSQGGTIPSTSGWTVASDGKSATKSVIRDNTYGNLPVPTRTGYSFEGWYTNIVKTVTFVDKADITSSTGAYNGPRGVNYATTPDLIPIKGGTTLYSNMEICGIYTYDSSGNFIKRESSYTTTHPISSNAAYIRIELNTSSVSYDTYMSKLVINDIPNTQALLPSDYQQVQYIESSGTQYINTGLAENAAYGMKISAKITGTAIAWQSLVSGTLDNFTFGTRDLDKTGFYIRLRTAEVYNKAGVLSTGINNLSIKNGVVNLNGSQVATYTHGALSTANKSLYIFANNALSRYGIMQLYSLEFYDSNGSTVRNFIPCFRKSDGVVGLYDTVTATFYANSGTGTFKFGDNVTSDMNVKIPANHSIYPKWTVISGPSISVTNTVNGSAYNGSWTNKDITSVINFSDPTGVSPSTLAYSCDNVNWTTMGNTSTSTFTDTWTAERGQICYYKICNTSGICSTASFPIYIDKTAPSAPTAMEFVYGSWARYTQGTWARESVYAVNTTEQHGPTGATDNASGIAKYQISSDNSNWVDYSYAYSASETVYSMHNSGTHTRYFRAVDGAGNVSSSISRTAKIDLAAPSISVTNTAGGSAYSGAWTNQDVVSTVTFSDTGSSGINASSLSYSCDGTNYTAISNTSTSSYTHTWNTERNNTCYFKICDVAGHCTTTGGFAIKVDKTAPTYSSVEIKNVTVSGYDVYIYGVSDASSVNRVQFPTWTALNGQDDIQSNWGTNSAASGTNQGNGTWYYRVNVTDHNSEAGAYNTHIYLYDSLGQSRGIGNDAVTVPTITVSYDANGGSGAPASQTKKYGVTLTLSSTIPTRTNYKFKGWSTSSTATSATYSAGGSYTTNVSTTLYAVWEENPPAKVTLTSLGLTPSSGTPNFGNTSCSSGCDEATVGIYKSTDDLGPSYYFRGDVTNNYVRFAGYYWRIVRINGDGSIRMIYDGTSAYANGVASTNRQVTTIAYKTSLATQNRFVGYMYGTNSTTDYTATHTNTTDSTIKNYLENTWYTNNILGTTYEQYVVDAIYCNDREVSTADSSYQGSGVGTQKTAYKAYERIRYNSTPTPTLICSNQNDRFTKNSSVGTVSGNAKLKYPIGLITVDEASYAGALRTSTNDKFYLEIGSDFYTMSPAHFNGDARMFSIAASGAINTVKATEKLGVRPVISISASSIIDGNGNGGNPFKVYKKGDVNRDRVINQTDADLVLDYTINAPTDLDIFYLADMNNDSKIDVDDVLLVNEKL